MEASSLTLLRVDPRDLRAERYTLSTSGEFGSSGGLDARESRTTWSTTIPREQALAILSPLDDPQWWRRLSEVEGGGGPEAAVRTSIEWRGPDWNRSREVAGDPEVLQPLLESLRSISRRRFDATLDALPGAGDRFRR